MWDTGPSWIIIVCVVLAVILLVVIVRFVVKKLNNCHKTPKYNSVTGDEEQGRSHLPVDGGSLSLLDREEVQADTRTIDSGLPTPLSAHSSSSTITQTDIDGTLGFECERHISRTANEAKQQVIKNKNSKFNHYCLYKWHRAFSLHQKSLTKKRLKIVDKGPQ